MGRTRRRGTRALPIATGIAGPGCDELLHRGNAKGHDGDVLSEPAQMAAVAQLLIYDHVVQYGHCVQDHTLVLQ